MTGTIAPHQHHRETPLHARGGALVRRAIAAALLLAVTITMAQEKKSAVDALKIDYRNAPHSYWDKPVKDVFTALLAKLQSGAVKLEAGDETTFVRSLLAALDVPVSSQLLVYSGTSMQSSLINPRNPRAIYFNEDVYIGVVPGGRVEVLSIDPELGGIFHIFDRPQGGGVPVADRSTRCFNCHAAIATDQLPGLITRSVAPIASGASYESYRKDEDIGHAVPLAIRFGGWHVTSAKSIGTTKEGVFAENSGGGIRITRIKPGELADLRRYLVPTSDILPHLIHEHQIGFDNRVIKAAYVAREIEAKGGILDAAQRAILDEQARILVRYILFADEAKLPSGGIAGDEQYAKDFARNKKPTATGASLKDLDLRTRIFKNRCSYMIYSPQWQALPASIKTRVYAGMKSALSGRIKEFAYLPADERSSIVNILRETLPDLPSDWRTGS